MPALALFAVDLNAFAAHVTLGFVAGLVTGLAVSALAVRWVLREQARRHLEELRARALEESRRQTEQAALEQARKGRTMWGD
jgi:hypothetical protein